MMMKFIFFLCIFFLWIGNSSAQITTQGEPLELQINGTTYMTINQDTGVVEVTRPIVVGTTSDPSATACVAGEEGASRYNSGDKTIEFCDGSAWQSIETSQSAGGAAATFPSGTGYFVMTSGTYDGDLGGLAGGDDLCLADLLANDWMGKADATSRDLLNAKHVKIFLCQENLCSSAIPNVAYAFAVSGDATKGGATFTANGDGRGPNNAISWHGTNYFDGAKYFWSGRRKVSETEWDNTGGVGAETCGSDFSSTGSTAEKGYTLSTDSNRWNTGERIDCTTQFHLICFVHP